MLKTAAMPNKLFTPTRPPKAIRKIGDTTEEKHQPRYAQQHIYPLQLSECITVTINSQVSSRWLTWYRPDMSSVYLWIALILPATASSPPKHAWTASSFWSWTSQFFLVYWGCLRMTGWFIFCSNISGLKGRAGTIVARTQRNGSRRKGAASYWAEYIWRNWSHTILPDLWRTSWSLIFSVTGMKNARVAYAKRQMKLFFLCCGTRQFYKRYNSLSAKRTWNQARWTSNFRLDIASWTKIEGTSYTKLMSTSYRNKQVQKLLNYQSTDGYNHKSIEFEYINWGQTQV